MILIRHDHQFAVAERGDTVFVGFAVFETQNLLQIGDFGVLLDLFDERQKASHTHMFCR